RVHSQSGCAMLLAKPVRSGGFLLWLARFEHRNMSGHLIVATSGWRGGTLWPQPRQNQKKYSQREGKSGLSEFPHTNSFNHLYAVTYLSVPCRISCPDPKAQHVNGTFWAERTTSANTRKE